jgi:hypothetical protein
MVNLDCMARDKPWTVVTSTALLRLVNPDVCATDIDKELEFAPF